MGYAVSLEGVSFYKNGQAVLEGIDLQVPFGEFLVVIGPNGGGKSTLLKIIAGLQSPSCGKVSLFNGSFRDGADAVGIGYVPQNISVNTDFPVTVLDVVLMGRVGSGVFFSRYSSADYAFAEDALHTLDMWDKRHRKIGELSGGERQRVFIARALAGEPKLLLFDEPTASIDAGGQKRFHDILAGLKKKMTIVVVSHDMSILFKGVDRVAFVNRRLHLHDTPSFSSQVTEELSRNDGCIACPVEMISQVEALMQKREGR